MKQRIIITWGAGFIGSNFLNLYVSRNPDIDFINLDVLTYAGNLENIDTETTNAENYFFERVDIRNIEELRRVYQKYTPTDIIHFAAETHVDNSIIDPFVFTETNILGTQNLLECHREFHLRRFHHISTDEVYGASYNGEFFTEEAAMNPSSPYSASKAASDLLVRAYGITFWIDYVITRCSNNYGPNQHSEKLIPHFITLLRKNQPVTLYGDGMHIRDWLFVADHCDAIWNVFSHAKTGSLYNIGDNNECTNLEITKILLKEMGKDDNLIGFVADRAGHDFRYALDTSKIKNELDWVSKTQFETGIAKTLEYYLKN